MMGLRRCQFLKWQGHTKKDKSLKYILMPNRTFFKDKKNFDLTLRKVVCVHLGDLKTDIGEKRLKMRIFLNIKCNMPILHCASCIEHYIQYVLVK